MCSSVFLIVFNLYIHLSIYSFMGLVVLNGNFIYILNENKNCPIVCACVRDSSCWLKEKKREKY